MRDVLASSIAPVHRQNFVGMRILPLVLPKGMDPGSLGIATETDFEIATAGLGPAMEVDVTLTHEDRALIETDRHPDPSGSRMAP